MAEDRTDGGDGASLAVVAASEYRQMILASLMEGPATPSAISKSEGMKMAHVSRGLTNLRENDLVELLVPEETKKGRVYGITDSGRVTMEKLRGGEEA